MKPKFEIDFTSFKYGLMELRAQVERTSPAGVMRAMSQFKQDCLNKVPKCPVDTGDLARAHKLLPVKKEGSVYTGTLAIVGIAYAASLHEGISRWGTPYRFKNIGAGAKWIETKMIAYGSEYVRIASDELHK